MAKKNEPQKPNTDKFLVSQSNDLVEATYSTALTARAHKVARLLLALIKPDDHDLRLYSVKIEDLKEYLGNSGGAVTWGRFYEDLKDISKRLNSEPIEIKSDKKALVAYFISSYEIDLRAGTVTYEISSQLKPYLIQLKGNFTAYQLSNIPKLNSKYSIRLYELLHQYRRFGRRVFEMSDLQRKIGSEYEKYSHFKTRVLDATKADLEANSDLSFDYEEIKEGKKVARIEFFIYSSQPQKKKTDGAPPPVLSFIADDEPIPNKIAELSEETIATLRGLGIHTKNIEKQLALGFKIIADEQMRAFARTKQPGAIMDRGLWAWTRHPNYFGDATLWWGFGLFALSTPGAWWTLAGPLLMTVLLVRVSGAALLERSMSARPGWAEYAARTSGFFPLPPRR